MNLSPCPDLCAEPPVTTEMFEAYWEDRGAELAGLLDEQKIDLPEHISGLMSLVSSEMVELAPEKRSKALECLLRGYRHKLHALTVPRRE